MKIPHRKKDYFIPIMIVVSIILSAIAFSSHSSGTSTLLSKGLSLISSPLESVTKNIYDFCSSVGGYFGSMDTLMKENEILKKENKQLTEENLKVNELKNENDSLYKFLELKKEHTDYKLTNCNVISKTSSGYSSVFTIDKGSFHGIKPDMPVISEEGILLGVTYSVEPNSTRCKSIISYDMSIGVYDEQSGETAIVSGYFDTFSQNKCFIHNLPDTTTIAVGDKILTSGLGEIYPRGLEIGVVESFVPDAGTHTMGAVIKPDESSLACDRVMVITSFERTYK